MQNYLADIYVLKAAEAFGFNKEAQIIPINSGLINSTYKISDNRKGILLQQINKKVFNHPEDIISNYNKIYSYLKVSGSFSIPVPEKLIDQKDFFKDENMNYWRATSFIENAYSPEIPQSTNEVYQAANCFGNFTKALAGFDISGLKIIIPRFHDLSLRYDQFSQAVENGFAERKNNSANEITELQKRKRLVDFYTEIIKSPEYKQRVMHHDAKLSNILFDLETKQVICPVDLDTVQPGYFFSDIGDMIRSMACSHSENSVEFNQIFINSDFYRAILNGYSEAMVNELTEKERKNIHYAGLMMIYMQSLRYLTDYLNKDIYYRINYTEQNFDRAKNQLTLLSRLEEFLAKEYGFSY